MKCTQCILSATDCQACADGFYKLDGVNECDADCGNYFYGEDAGNTC